MVKERIELTILYDIYKETLTEKQKNCFEMYYFNDMSLSEIAELEKISRAAVSDSLKKTKKIILNLEEKIKVNELYKLKENE